MWRWVGYTVLQRPRTAEERTSELHAIHNRSLGQIALDMKGRDPMTTGGMKASADVLSVAAKDVKSTQEELDGIINDIRTKLDHLNTAWQGKGGQAFQGAILAWQRTANRVTGAMDNFHASLLGTEQTYDETEDHVAGGLNRYQDGAL